MNERTADVNVARIDRCRLSDRPLPVARSETMCERERFKEEMCAKR